MFIWTAIKRLLTPKHDYGSLKTVTFGDESAVTSNTVASVVSVVLFFLFWCAFTGSKLLPGFLHALGAFIGDGSFTYTITTPDGQTDDATVTVVVHPVAEDVTAPEVAPGAGIAKDDSIAIASYRSALLRVDRNDEMGRDEDTFITAVNGQAIAPEGSVTVDFGTVAVSAKGTLNILPSTGLQMEPIWLPAPEAVWLRMTEIATVGFRNSTLMEHLGYSLFRVVVGFFLGALVGIIGFSIDMLMRWVERVLVPWKGKG